MVVFGRDGNGRKEKIFLIDKVFFLIFVFIEFFDVNVKFYCRFYYAGEFYKMREVILGSSEEDFIRFFFYSVFW